MPKTQPPDPDSNSTNDKATALAEARGCVYDNPCWSECFDAAKYHVLNGPLDEWDRRVIHDGVKAMYRSRAEGSETALSAAAPTAVPPQPTTDSIGPKIPCP